MKNNKFRRYDIRLNEMRYSNKHDGEFYINLKGVMYMYAIPKSELSLATKYYKSYDTNQFTGLLDINGKEVYEKDLLRIKMGNDWQEMYVLVKDLWDLHLWINNSDGYFRVNSFEVLGNYYQNPELMENTCE